MGGDYKWPTVKETKEYRRKVRKLINDVIDRTQLELPVTMNSKWVCSIFSFNLNNIVK